MPDFDLKQHGITVTDIRRNPSPAKLYDAGVKEDGSTIAASGALVAFSGEKTGRSPNDKHVVREPGSEADVWWGPVNFPIEPDAFETNLKRTRAFLNARDHLYCVDGFAGWDPEYRVRVRIICSRPYHALFMHNMIIRPTPEELESFGEPDYVIYNAGQHPADPSVPGVNSTTSVDLNLSTGEVSILGTEYAGEMKKGVFTIMNYLMPKLGELSMHCSATANRDDDSSSLLFGLSGTGKTTLSADPNRLLIGDDEHVWTERGVFNIEGGCYAKTIDLTLKREPDIYRAIRFGAVLENVVLGQDSRADYTDATITENTRGSYPLEFIDNTKIPAIAGQPTDVIFLTADAFGVLPPVSKLSPAQAMYHFISGYTAKVAGTEVGITEPQATFSPCFGGPFLVWHPAKYAELLAHAMQKYDVNVWLVSTGWSGGPYGVGSRIRLRYTRAIVDAIHKGTLADAPTVTDPVFGFEVVTQVPEVPPAILIPRDTWDDPAAYDEMAAKLAGLFNENFAEYVDHCEPEVREAGPRV